MTFELIVKIVADGFVFTPNAVVRDVGGAMTLFIYVVSSTFVLYHRFIKFAIAWLYDSSTPFFLFYFMSVFC